LFGRQALIGALICQRFVLDAAEIKPRPEARHVLAAVKRGGDLLTLVAPSERGDAMSPLRWTCKSVRRLAAELRPLGHRISHTVVGEVLKQQKFSLQGNHKMHEGDSHPDRDAQFAHIKESVTRMLADKQPPRQRFTGATVEVPVAKFVDELGIEINVHHLPPGTGKWSKIERRLFSFISMNGRAKPFVSYRVIVVLNQRNHHQCGPESRL
jgi:hypothetical protein